MPHFHSDNPPDAIPCEHHFSDRTHDMARTHQAARRLTPEQLRDALRDIGISRDDLALVLGTRTERVGKWTRGEEDAPIYLDALLALMTLPGALDLVEDVMLRRAGGSDNGEA